MTEQPEPKQVKPKPDLPENPSAPAESATGPLDLRELEQAHLLERWEHQRESVAVNELLQSGLDQDSIRAAELLNDLFCSRPSAMGDEDILKPESIGRFEIRELLGVGRFGVVWRAFDPEVAREVALKVIHQAQMFDPNHRRRFLRECQIAARLDHPSICPVFEAGSIAGTPYLVMPICEGVTLDRWQQMQRGLIDFQVVARVIRELAVAVAYGHRLGVLHRDLKPSNIMLAEGTVREGALTLRVLDFGLAIPLDVSLRDTRSSLIAGTPNYMAPEQALCQTHRIGKTSDLFSIGAILYELLTARTPFESNSLPALIERIESQSVAPVKQFCPQVPRDLEAICLKCLAHDPESRYLEADDLVRDLEAFLAGGEVLARPKSQVQRALEWCSLKRGRQLLATAIIVINLVVLTWSLFSIPTAVGQIEPGKLSVAEVGAILAPLFGGIVPLHLGLIWLAVRIWRQPHQGFYARIGAIISAIVWAFAILVLFGWLPATPSPAYQSNPFARQVAFVLVSTSFAALAGIFSLLAFTSTPQSAVGKR